MTTRKLDDPNVPIGSILQAAGEDGLLLTTEAKDYALIPLEDDVLDFLIERSPRFRMDCERIREQMRAGQFHSHADVTKLLSGPDDG